MTDKATQLTVAMSTIDSGIEPPSRRRSSSFAAAVADLDVGESASRAVQIDGDQTLTQISGQLTAMKSDLRNNTAPAVRRARERIAGSDYTIEIGEMLTFTGKLFLVAIVTRVS